MRDNARNINIFWGELIVEELCRCGVEYFCIAPGARSAPLVSAVASNNKLRSFVHFDERGAAFHAMGYVAASGKPAALILTSGTAVANALPAVIEASKKKLPLIVISADRPIELQKTGAHQTIEQEGVYGVYVRWSFVFPSPTDEVPAAFVLTTVDQAVSRAKGDIPGPVHLNCPFREPLSDENIRFHRKKLQRSIAVWKRSGEPYTVYVLSPRIPVDANTDLIARRISRIRNGIIAVGKLSGKADEEAVLSFSEQTGFPIFPDIASGLRLGKDHPNVVAYYDQLLLAPELVPGLDFDGIIHFGGRMTSRRFYDFCESHRGLEYISVLSHPLRSDPLHVVTLRVQSGVRSFIDAVSGKIDRREAGRALSLLRSSNQAVERILERCLSGREMNEMGLARMVSKLLEGGSGLFLSNSMPVRDMDMYACPSGRGVRVAGNRGASGIDGIVASAAGFAVGLGRPVTLLIGDQAFLHDLNSLAMLARLKVPVTLVLVNNGGGGIFSFLSLGQDEAFLEKYIAGQHGLTFRKAAELFGLDYYLPADLMAFSQDYGQAQKMKKSCIIECCTTRSANFAAHKRLQRKITEMLSRRKNDV